MSQNNSCFLSLSWLTCEGKLELIEDTIDVIDVFWQRNEEF